MASQPINPGQGGAPGGAPQPAQGGAPQGQNNPLQILAAMTRLAQMLASAAPNQSQVAEQMIQLVQQAAQKMIPQQGGGQPQPGNY